MENTKNFIEDKGHENWSRKIILTQLANEGTQKYISLLLTLTLVGFFFGLQDTFTFTSLCVCVHMHTLASVCLWRSEVNLLEVSPLSPLRVPGTEARSSSLVASTLTH